jgi:hypothetical protein
MENKTYQVLLSKENQQLIISILFQLSPNGKITVLPDELPIDFPLE